MQVIPGKFPKLLSFITRIRAVDEGGGEKKLYFHPFRTFKNNKRVFGRKGRG